MFKPCMSVVVLFLAGSVWAQDGRPAPREHGQLPLSTPSAVTTATAPDLLAAQLTDTAFAVPCPARGPFRSTLQIGDGPPLPYDGDCPAATWRAQSDKTSTALADAEKAVMAKPDCFNLPNDGCLRLRYIYRLEQPIGKLAHSSEGWVNFDNYVYSISGSVDARWGSIGADHVICTGGDRPAGKPEMKHAVFFLGHLDQDVRLTIVGGAVLRGRIRGLNNTGALCVSLIRPDGAGLSLSNPEPTHALNRSCQDECNYTLQAWDESKRLRLAITGTLLPAVSGLDPALGKWRVPVATLGALLLLFPILSIFIACGFSGVRRVLRVSPTGELEDAMRKVWAYAPGPLKDEWDFKGSYSLARFSVFIWTLLTLELLVAHFVLSGDVSLAVATTTAALMGIQLINVTLSAPTEDAQRKKWLDDYAAWMVAGCDPATAALLKGRAKNLWAHYSLMSDLLYKSPAAEDQIVFSRLQMIVFSVCVYIWIIAEFCASGAVPPLSNELLALAGVSSGAYMGFKLSQPG